MSDWIIIISIHGVVPLIGFLLYLYLEKKMRDENVPHSPIYQYFWIFGVYGVLLILILTGLFWKWSGMTSLGLLWLITLGPIAMGYITIKNYRLRRLTKYHTYAYALSVGFFAISIFLLLVLKSI